MNNTQHAVPSASYRRASELGIQQSALCETRALEYLKSIKGTMVRVIQDSGTFQIATSTVDAKEIMAHLLKICAGEEV